MKEKIKNIPKSVKIIIGICILFWVFLISLGIKEHIIKYQDSKLSATVYKEKCMEVTYDEIARNPKKFEDKKVKVTGIVDNVWEKGFINHNDYEITIYENDPDEEYSHKYMYIDYTYKKNEEHFIINDNLTVYGVIYSISGSDIYIAAQHIELNN